MNIPICTKCKNKLAISPEGLCNICDENSLSKLLAAHRTGVPPIIVKPKKNNE